MGAWDPASAENADDHVPRGGGGGATSPRAALERQWNFVLHGRVAEAEAHGRAPGAPPAAADEDAVASLVAESAREERARGEEGLEVVFGDFANRLDALQTNVLGVMRTVEALTPSLLLSPSPRLVHISGIFGSLTNQVRVGTPSPDVAERTGSAGYFIYRSSKAAANMVAK